MIASTRCDTTRCTCRERIGARPAVNRTLVSTGAHGNQYHEVSVYAVCRAGVAVGLAITREEVRPVNDDRRAPPVRIPALDTAHLGVEVARQRVLDRQQRMKIRAARLS